MLSGREFEAVASFEILLYLKCSFSFGFLLLTLVSKVSNYVSWSTEAKVFFLEAMLVTNVMHSPIASGTPFLVAADMPQAESAVVDREVSTGRAKLTALEVPTTILVECEGQPLREATPQSVEVAFVAQHPIRGCLPTHRQTLPREFVAQHPLRGCLPTHSHCRCQCGRA